ncbi:TetR family transcriptional regulator [Streptomyces sp. SAS_272]|uniref:TetR family transcriptional regulator n=1 Tax=Streptomyces sp. SAS_272 TaxID=3412747 RepID=UPI00403CE46E
MTGAGLREMKKAEVEQAVQPETLRLFAERGRRETTVGQIAAAAETSTTTLHRHRPSKEEVLLSGIQERGQGEGRGGRERSLHVVPEPPAGASAVEGLRAGGRVGGGGAAGGAARHPARRRPLESTAPSSER